MIEIYWTRQFISYSEKKEEWKGNKLSKKTLKFNTWTVTTEIDEEKKYSSFIFLYQSDSSTRSTCHGPDPISKELASGIFHESREEKKFGRSQNMERSFFKNNSSSFFVSPLKLAVSKKKIRPHRGPFKMRYKKERKLKSKCHSLRAGWILPVCPH